MIRANEKGGCPYYGVTVLFRTTRVWHTDRELAGEIKARRDTPKSKVLDRHCRILPGEPRNRAIRSSAGIRQMTGGAGNEDLLARRKRRIVRHGGHRPGVTQILGVWLPLV